MTAICKLICKGWAKGRNSAVAREAVGVDRKFRTGLGLRWRSGASGCADLVLHSGSVGARLAREAFNSVNQEKRVIFIRGQASLQ